MAAPIRPPVWPPAPATLQPGRADVRATAQRAFFQAALAGKPAPTVLASPVAAATPPTPAPRAAPREASAADRIPRPGSIIDIRV